jgi:hypothetical protein
MIRTGVLGVGFLLGLAGAASAQYPYGGGYGGYGGYGGFGSPGYGSAPNVMPNIYNPRTQPLSPYLNLLRGGNPGVNYYYGVRPGTVGGAAAPLAPGIAPGGNRPAYFPVQYGDADPLELPTADTDRGYVIPPAGHPVMFNNTLGYFPGGPGARGGSPRSGLSSGGGTRPATRR